MITKEVLELLHQGAHIQRWNDHIRPKGFTELDKQAQKMIITYIIAKFEEDDRKATINWRKLVEGGIFEYLQRIVLTDIKPPIFYELMSKHGDKLNRWVLGQLKEKLQNINGSFYNKFEKYLLNPEYSRPEKKILKASHYLASNWEFKIIYNLNSGIFGINETKARIENELEEHYDLAGVQKIGLGKKTSDFLDLVGQLRFQQRWAQSPRVPETSVMGHMLIVAFLSYLCSLEVKACDNRISNNFFSALFHDLPEVLTRDIISPVKRSVPELEELIKEIEDRQLEEKIFPLLPVSWHQDIKFLIRDEFKSKIMDRDEMRFVSSTEINERYNSNNYSPLDGEIVKACDHLAAFIETFLSRSHGITSHHLEEGAKSLSEQYHGKTIAGLDFGQLFQSFHLPNKECEEK